jgi:hypothetical protein
MRLPREAPPGRTMRVGGRLVVYPQPDDLRHGPGSESAAPPMGLPHILLPSSGVPPVRRRRKQVLLAMGLGVVFGPIGLLYSTRPGAAAMAGVNLVAALVTHGEALVFTWPMSGLLGFLAALAHNAEFEVERLVGSKR